LDHMVYIADDDSTERGPKLHKSLLVDSASRYRLCLLHVALVPSATKLLNTVTVFSYCKSDRAYIHTR